MFEILLYLLLARREVRAGWGDVRRGVYQSLIRWSLVKLAARPSSARDWRPHVLAFVDDIERRLGLVRYGALFSQGRGVVTVCRLVEGDLQLSGGTISLQAESHPLDFRKVELLPLK